MVDSWEDILLEIDSKLMKLAEEKYVSLSLSLSLCVCVCMHACVSKKILVPRMIWTIEKEAEARIATVHIPQQCYNSV